MKTTRAYGTHRHAPFIITLEVNNIEGLLEDIAWHDILRDEMR